MFAGQRTHAPVRVGGGKGGEEDGCFESQDSKRGFGFLVLGELTMGIDWEIRLQRHPKEGFALQQ